MDIMQYTLAIAAGILAGIINTLAGSGSAVTLPMLVFLGLDPSVANATNRVGVMVQNIVGITTFQRSGKMNLSGGLWLTVPAMLGSVLGAWVATILDKEAMNIAIGAMLLIVLVTILFDPKKWLRVQSEVKPGRPSTLTLLIFFAIGVYGGFIQAGVGVFILTAMVLGTGYTLVHANAIKLMVVLALTVVALVVFMLSPLQIDWGIGAVMAVGQSIGAWLAAKFAVSNPNANIWVRRLLIVVVVYSILRFFGIWDWAMALI
ncbi:MAG: sulfite exporter TauE/SafE family protein [Caldilineaceae bacterium]|nr:sulfite exporter TauE/SafE family protein [Caldilineaceae bacterium]